MSRAAAAGGRRPDRPRRVPIAFEFDGAPLTGFAGDTLASALLANGVDIVARSIYDDRPRGVDDRRPRGAERARPGRAGRTACPSRWSGRRRSPLERGSARLVAGRARAGWSTGRDDAADSTSGTPHVEVLVVGAGASGLPRPRPPPATADPVRPGAACLDADPAASGDGVRRRHDRARRLRPRLRDGRPAPSDADGPRAGCGTSAPAGSCSRPAPRSGRSSSPTTTGPGSCSRARPRPTSSGTASGRATGRVVFTTNDTTDARRRRRCARPGSRSSQIVDARRGEVVVGTGARRRRPARRPSTIARATAAARRDRRGRPAAGVRRLEPERRAVEPGPRHAPLRRADRGVRPGPARSARAHRGRRRGRRRDRGPRRDRAGRGSSRRRRRSGARTPGPRTTSTSSATRPSRDLRRALGAGLDLDRARQALHDDRHGRRPGQDVGRRGLGRSPRRSSARRSAPSACRRTGRRSSRSASPSSPAATAATSLDPIRTTPIHAWHVAARRGLRGRRPVEAAALLPASTASRWTTAVLRECAVGADRGRGDGRHDPRQDRPPGPGRRRSSSTASTPTPSRRSRSASCRYGVMCRRRRDGLRRRRDRAARRRPVPDDDDDRQRRRGPRPPRGVAPDRMAGPARPGDQRHRAVGDGRGRRPALARRSSRRSRRGSTSRIEAFPFMTWRDAVDRGDRRARVPDLVLRGAGVRAQRAVGSRAGAVGGRDGRRRAARDHAVRHGDACTSFAPRRATRSSARRPTGP